MALKYASEVWSPAVTPQSAPISIDCHMARFVYLQSNIQTFKVKLNVIFDELATQCESQLPTFVLLAIVKPSCDNLSIM